MGKEKLASWILMLSGLGLVTIIDRTDYNRDLFGMDWETQRKIGGFAILLGGLGVAITSFISITKK